jgi:fatty acid-binding protein DegV
VEQGKVEAVAKARGQQTALQWLEDRLERQKPDLQYPVMFGHSAAPQLCQDFADRVLSRLPGCAKHIAQIGSAVGTHVGPGAVGLAYIERE